MATKLKISQKIKLLILLSYSYLLVIPIVPFVIRKLDDILILELEKGYMFNTVSTIVGLCVVSYCMTFASIIYLAVKKDD